MNNSAKNKFELLDLIKKISEKWYVLTFLLFIGGAAGLAVSFFKPPIFQSSASFSVIIDYTQTGALSDVQEDQAMRGVGYLLLSDHVIDETLASIKASYDTVIERERFLENASIDRGDFNWTIRYRGQKPEDVYRIVDTWASSSLQNFENALIHANTAQSYLTILNRLINSYQLTSEETDNRSDDPSNLKRLEEIVDLSQKISEEKELAKGLFFALSIHMTNDATLADTPIRNQTNLFVISGALAGIFTGLFILLVRIFKEEDRS